MGSVTLPEGHMLSAGTETVPAGTSREIGRTTVTCPAGGPDCIITVTDEHGHEHRNGVLGGSRAHDRGDATSA